MLKKSTYKIILPTSSDPRWYKLLFRANISILKIAVNMDNGFSLLSFENTNPAIPIALDLVRSATAYNYVRNQLWVIFTILPADVKYMKDVLTWLTSGCCAFYY